MVSTVAETNTVGCGGLCLITDFEGAFMGQEFPGMRITYTSRK